ncbi:MAG TPA: DegT/DnrJ/EryC1/StrS family aminotransferase [bacterium]|nr:DegT/DnrJ/EryC1/StrS family aminotransferase [bacterium]
MKNYTPFKPFLKSPEGLSKFMIKQLLSRYERGVGGVPSEIASVLKLLCDDASLPHISYIHTEGGAVKKLADIFISYLSDSSSESELSTSFMKINGWDEIPFYAAGLASATSALYLALLEAGAKGGEVITTSFNYVGVINAIYMSGATPVFIDVDSDHWMMDPNLLESAINNNTRAIVLTHLNQFADLSPYLELYERKGLEIPFIQDASVAMGSKNGGLHPGILNLGVGGATIFSLATSKVLTGLGGALMVSNDESFLHRILTMAYQGIDLTGGAGILLAGGNFKMNDINAAIAIEQLRRAKEIFGRRRRLKEFYDLELADLEESGKLKMQSCSGEPVVTHYPIKVAKRDSLAAKMAADGIILSRWHACHMEEFCRVNSAKAGSGLPVTEDLQERLTFLPFYADLTESDIKFIAENLKGKL